MTVTAHQLLTRAAARFRSYEANHRDKVNKITSNVKDRDERNKAIEETLSKAGVNARAALEIEQFLTDNPDFETVRSSDAFDRYDMINLLRRAHDEIVGLRRRVDHLEPQAHAYATIAQIARLSIDSVPPQGAEVDVAWRLKELVDRLREKDADKAQVS